MKEVKSTLDGFEFNYERRSGNSTKQIDLAIDYLFSGYKVKVEDHWEDGKYDHANDNLFKRVLRRLQNEHPEIKVKIDKDKLTIELL